MRPPFEVTSKILALVTEISLLVGRYEGVNAPVPQPKLRRGNRVKTIQASLEIEGNSLSLEQATALFDKRRVIGPKKDILEVQNAILLYESMQGFDPMSVKALCKAHAILMKGLAADAGKFRAGAVGIFKGSKVSHVAPPARNVPKLVDDLLRFVKAEKELSFLVRACVFHYEFEFIHPFTDGNGRLGRFWQTLLLTRFHPAFEYVPVELAIQKRQVAYYHALEQSDKNGNSTAFVEFSLETIRDALRGFLEELRPEPETPDSRLSRAAHEFTVREFTRKDYLTVFKTISTATASRDLALGVAQKRLKKAGAKALTKYRFLK